MACWAFSCLCTCAAVKSKPKNRQLNRWGLLSIGQHLKSQFWDSSLAQWVKVHAVKSEDPSSSPKTLMKEGNNRCQELSSDCHTHTVACILHTQNKPEVWLEMLKTWGGSSRFLIKLRRTAHHPGLWMTMTVVLHWGRWSHPLDLGGRFDIMVVGTSEGHSQEVRYKGIRHMRTLTGDRNSQGQGCALKDWLSGDWVDNIEGSKEPPDGLQGLRSSFKRF